MKNTLFQKNYEDVKNILEKIVERFENKTKIRTFQDSDNISKGALNEIFNALITEYRFEHFDAAKFICSYFGFKESYLLKKLYKRHLEDIKINAMTKFPAHFNKDESEEDLIDFIFID